MNSYEASTLISQSTGIREHPAPKRSRVGKRAPRTGVDDGGDKGYYYQRDTDRRGGKTETHPKKKKKKSKKKRKKKKGKKSDTSSESSSDSSDSSDKKKKKKKKKKCTPRCQYTAFIAVGITFQIIVLALGACAHGDELAKSPDVPEKIGFWVKSTKRDPNLTMGMVTIIIGNGCGLVLLVLLIMCVVKKIKGKLAFGLLIFFAFLQYFSLLIGIWYLAVILRNEFQAIGWCYILPMVGWICSHYCLACPFHPACINPSSADSKKKESSKKDKYQKI